MNKKILITGAAGFIGFHLSKSLLKDNYLICGLDNMNDYYSVKIKKDRLRFLNNYKTFQFIQTDISNLNDLSKVFLDFKPDIVVNLAAQAGVRYSIDNPFVYINSNIVGFANIIELCKVNNVEGLIYASSSSVYGDNKNTPFSINDKVDTPISLYGASKISNELIAHSYSHLFDLHTTGLRFFTAYGPWGRPDMAYYGFTEKISSNKPIDVFNNGEMKRDFTYIDDIINGIKSSIDNNYKCEIFNIGNNKSEKLMDLISCIEKELNKKAIINYMPMQPADVKSTHADIRKTKEMLNYRPSIDMNLGIKKFISWYKEYELGYDS